MSITSVKELLSNESLVGKAVTAAGWVKTRRDSKAGFSFISVNDGSIFESVQVVAPSSLPNYESEILKLTTGCSVAIDGELVESQGKGQSVEIRATAVKVLGFVDDPDTYPMSAKRHSAEYLRQYAHLRPRTNLIGAVMRIRNACAFAIH